MRVEGCGVVGDVVRGLFARALVWGDVYQSPRGPKLTAAAQAPLQLNCCNTGSSTAASCCHKGCPQRLRHTSRQGALARRHTDGPIWAALL